MVQNPIVQVALMVVGAYYALGVLSRYWPPLGPIVTVASGVFGAIIWILENEKRLAADLHRTNPVARPLIELVCRATKRPFPGGAVEAAVARETATPASDAPPSGGGGEKAKAPPAPQKTKLLLESDADFYDAAARLKKVVKGYDSIIDGLMTQLRQRLRLRTRSDPHTSQPPLGFFLLVGRDGLGKRYLAEQIAWLVYENGPLTELDLADEGSASPKRLIEAVKAKSRQTVILENVDRVGAAYLERLHAIASGNSLRDPTTGAVVSFRDCVFFLIAHKPAEQLAEIQKASMTQVTATIAELVGLPPSLVTLLHDYYAFQLPGAEEQADVVALLIEQECRKFNVQLGQIDPELLSREVRAISTSGGFAITPGRIAKRLQASIHETLARGGDTVDLVETSSREQSE
jgi:hypothetical protein